MDQYAQKAYHAQQPAQRHSALSGIIGANALSQEAPDVPTPSNEIENALQQLDSVIREVGSLEPEIEQVYRLVLRPPMPTDNGKVSQEGVSELAKILYGYTARLWSTVHAIRAINHRSAL